VVVPPGDLVNVQVPDEGNPLNATLPVAMAQLGCVIVPTIGAEGNGGTASITTFADEGDGHPVEVLTMKVYVPDGIPDTVVLVPVPVAVVPPGDLVNVQVPDEGKPLSDTLPVVTAQVGWVIVPTVGADGVFIVKFSWSKGLLLSTTSPDVGQPLLSTISICNVSPIAQAEMKLVI